MTIREPSQAIEQGIGFVTEDRKELGLVLGMSVRENFSLTHLSDYCRMDVVNRKRETNACAQYIKSLGIKTPSPEQKVLNLSGGNQQKVVIAKWLATKPRVIILDEPTKGIDIGSKAAVHDFMSELAAEGLAVIMVSSEIPEILGMSDRVIVMREGRIAAELTGPAMTPERLVGLAWRDKMELRLAGYASRRKAQAGKAIAGRRQMVKVVVVDLGDFRERHFGKSAG